MPAASPPRAAMIRAKLLSIISRPAVPLAPTDSVFSDEGSNLVREKLTITSAAGIFVPVVIYKLASISLPPKKLPVVFCLHGTSSNMDANKPFLKRAAARGYLACAFDARYHGERAAHRVNDYHEALVAAWKHGRSQVSTEVSTSLDGARGQPEPWPQEHPFMMDSAWDMMKVIDYLVTRQDVDAARIGTTGISLGGMHSWMAAVADPRIAVAAPAIGAQSYAWAVENASWTARVETIQPVFDEACKDLGKEAVDEEVLVAVWDKLLPGILGDLDGPSSLPTLAPRPLLICNGELDPRCPVPGVEQIAANAAQEYAAHGAPGNFELHIEKGVAHAVTAEMWTVIDQFLDKHLQPSTHDN